MLTDQIESLSDQNYVTKAKKSERPHKKHEPPLTHDSVASQLVKIIEVSKLWEKAAEYNRALAEHPSC